MEKCPFCKYIRIPEDKYHSLLRDREKLRALEAGGVDNWEWYGESLKDFYSDTDEGENDEDN